MTSGENLMARLGLDTTGFKAGLKDAHSAFQQFGGGLASALGVVGLGAYTKQLIEYGSTIQDLADRFKISTTALQRFGNAGEEVGTSLEGVARGFNKLAISQDRALAGGQAQIKAFANLGITIQDLLTLSPEELMLKMGKSSLNAADMVAILGKNALELRPLLQGLGDDSIKLGDAIDAGMIRQLDEADDRLTRLGQSFRMWAANNVLQNILDTGRALKDMSLDAGAAASRMWELAKAAASLDGGRTKSALKAFNDELPGHADWRAERERREAAKTGGDSSPARPRAPRELVEKAPSRSELSAQQKEADRDRLSFKELSGEGAQSAKRGAGGTYTQSTGTAQMIYFAQQAKLVEDLEAQAKQVRLTGISPTGESSRQLSDRARAIKDTLPIKESEKSGFKDALTDTNQKLDELIANTE